MKKTLPILITLLSTFISFSKTFVVDHVTYDITSTAPNTVTAISYSTAGGADLVIPASVTSGPSSYDVTVVGPAAFSNKQLTSVSLPITLTEIRSNAFSNNSLTSITIPSSVTNIQSWAFQGNSITSVISENSTPPSIPAAGVGDAFDDRALIDLTVPFGSLASYTTDSGAKWTGFNSATDTPDFTVDHVTYEITSTSPMTVRAKSYNSAGGTDLIIPETVTHAFNTYSVTSIGPNSFVNKQLNSVSLPQSIVVIRSSSFSNNNLTSITIPSGVLSIQSWAFMGNPITTVIAEGTDAPFLPNEGSGDSFDDRSTIDLSIPTGTMGEYVTNVGAKWTGFKSVTEGMLVGTLDAQLSKETVVSISQGELNITSLGSAQLEDYTIYSLSRSMKKGTERTIDISDLPHGIYILELNFDNGRFVEKFMK